MERRYTDMTSLNAYPTTSAYPTKDEDGNPLETEYGLSIYKDHQTFTIQVYHKRTGRKNLGGAVRHKARCLLTFLPD